MHCGTRIGQASLEEETPLTVVFLQSVMSVSIERFACTIDDPCAAASFAPVCGGRRFRRHFNKRDFPVLGEDYEDAIDRFDALKRPLSVLGIITLFE